MATRLQQRRGTAAQWISTNAGAGPVLNAGEIGWESDTNKFKIGDGVNNWANLDYFADINSTVNPAFGTSITFEGATADSYETTLQVTDPTADRTITLPNVTGTVITTGNLSDITDIGVFTSTIVMEGSTADAHELTISAGDPTADRTATFPDATGTIVLDTATQTLTNKTLTTPVISSITNGAATLTLPTSTGTIALTSDIAAGIVTETGTQTLTNKSISLGSNTVTSTLAQLNTAISDADVASLAGTETLTNKTLTTPVVSGLTISDGSIVLEGATANDFETTLTVTDPTADRTITFPDATGTVALTDSPTFTTTVKLPSSVEGPTSSTSVNLLFGTGAGNITLGGGQSSGNLTLGGGSGRTTGIIAIGTGATESGTKTINIGTGSTGGTTAITVGSSSGATSNITLNGTVTAANNLVVTGDLTVNGTTTTINSTTLAVDDKNITLGDVATPTDTTADGGGITLKGATDKTFNWVDATDAWTSSEHINLASGKAIYLNGTLETAVAQTLTNKTIALGSNTVSGTLAEFNTAVTDANLASLEGSETLTNKTLSSAVATTALTLNATAELRLADTDSTHYVGFKAPGTVSANKIWTLPAADGAAGQVLTTDGSGVFSFSTPAAGAAFSELMLIGA